MKQRTRPQKRLMTFEEFLHSALRNAWVTAPGLSLYVRKSKRDGVECIDLAAVKADVTGKGAFTAFLNKYEPKYNLYVESILEPRLVPYLERRGYCRSGANLSINMIRRRS